MGWRWPNAADGLRPPSLSKYNLHFHVILYFLTHLLKNIKMRFSHNFPHLFSEYEEYAWSGKSRRLVVIDALASRPNQNVQLQNKQPSQNILDDIGHACSCFLLSRTALSIVCNRKKEPTPSSFLVSIAETI